MNMIFQKKIDILFIPSMLTTYSFFFFRAQPFTHSRQFIDAVVHRLMKKESTDSGGNNFCWVGEGPLREPFLFRCSGERFILSKSLKMHRRTEEPWSSRV